MDGITKIRFVGLVLCLGMLAVCGALVLLVSPRPAPPEYGIHTHRGDGKELSLAAAAGFDWVVQLFSWKEAARWRDQYNWEHQDSVVRGAEYYGLNLVARLDQHPAWARAEHAENGPPDDLADYGDFVHDVALRYKGQIKAYIVWNEPNLALEWGGDRPDPAAYVEMLKVAYTRIKQADSKALVVSAGLAPTNEQSNEAIDDRVYLQAMYDAGAKEYFDVLGAHMYGFGRAPDDPRAAHGGLNIARVEDLRDVMVANGDADKPVWVTELGWTTAAPGDEAWQIVTEEEQAAYLVRALQRAREEWPWLRLIAVWNLGYGLSPEDEKAGYGVLRSDGEAKPAYRALTEMPKPDAMFALERFAERWRQIVVLPWQHERPRALAQDVVVHLGDNRWPTPWVPLYQGLLPSTEWSGEFYVAGPGEGTWTLHIDVMQNNERGNYIAVNGHALAPPYFPVEDYSRSWVSISYLVPAGYLRADRNEVTVVVSKTIPARHHPGAYEDLQFRDIVLERR